MDFNYVSNFEWIALLLVLMFLFLGYCGLGLLALLHLDDWMLDRGWKTPMPDNAPASIVVWTLWPLFCLLQWTRVKFYQAPPSRRFPR